MKACFLWLLVLLILGTTYYIGYWKKAETPSQPSIEYPPAMLVKSTGRKKKQVKQRKLRGMLPSSASFLHALPVESGESVVVRLSTVQRLKMDPPQWLVHDLMGNSVGFAPLTAGSSDPNEKYKSLWVVRQLGRMLERDSPGAFYYVYPFYRIEAAMPPTSGAPTVRVVQFCGDGRPACMAPNTSDPDQRVGFRFLDTNQSKWFQPMGKFPPLLPEELRGYAVANLVMPRSGNRDQVRILQSVGDVRSNLFTNGYPPGMGLPSLSMYDIETPTGPALTSPETLWLVSPAS